MSGKEGESFIGKDGPPKVTKVEYRVLPKTIRTIEELAERYNTTRTEQIRDAIADADFFYTKLLNMSISIRSFNGDEQTSYQLPAISPYDDDLAFVHLSCNLPVELVSDLELLAMINGVNPEEVLNSAIELHSSLTNHYYNGDKIIVESVDGSSREIVFSDSYSMNTSSSEDSR